MKKALLIGSCCLYLLSCGKDNLDIPEGVLNADTLSQIQAEFYLIEAANNLVLINHDTTKASYDEYYEHVLKRHHTSKAQIDSSLNFYAQFPEQLDSIFSKTLLILEKGQLKYQAQHHEK